jgi:hypothetical protein
MIDINYMNEKREKVQTLLTVRKGNSLTEVFSSRNN